MSKTEFTRLERYLYRYRHQDAHEQWHQKYYAVFTDWKGIARRIPLAESLQSSRNKLGELLRKNDGEYDFDAPAREAAERAAAAEKAKIQGITFREFGEKYFNGEIAVPLVRRKRPKRECTVLKERRLFDVLCSYFGDLPLNQIDKSAILDFSNKRVKVPVLRCRRPSIKSPRYIGLELKFLRYLLNRAADHNYITGVPRIEAANGGRRSGSIDPVKFAALIKAMPRPQARYFIALWETGWRIGELRKLNWRTVTHAGLRGVDLENQVLRLDPEDVKEDYPRTTPISKELMKVLVELRELASPTGAVFIYPDGRPIRSCRATFNMARERVGLPNAIPHDIRRSAIRRWESGGVPRGAAMQASGHRPSTVHEEYAELSEQELVNVFVKAGFVTKPKLRLVKKAG